MSSTLLPNSTNISNEMPKNLIAKGINTETSSKNDTSEEKGSFLNLILSKITRKEKVDATSTTVQDAKKAPQLDENMLLKEATFVQILQLLEQLSGSSKLGKIGNFDDKLKNLLQNSAVLEEFKNAKSLKDILALSKKYDLGLEKITITQKDIKQLEKTFPNLAKEGFFQPKKTIIASEVLLKKSKQIATPKETNIQNSTNNTPTTLSKILKELENKKSPKKIDKSYTTTAKADSTITEKTKTPTSKIDILPQTEKVRHSSSSLTQETTLNIQSKTVQNRLSSDIINQTIAKETLQETNAQEVSKTSEINTNIAKNNKTQLNTKSVDIKQTFNTFANDFKEQVEQYKPPLMKVQLALNPKHLGEMEVTIINRGTNLHVNFASNTQAMNLFIQNQAEFKNSLVNMGFTNLEMNFSDERKGHEHKKENSSSDSQSEGEDFEELTKNEDTILDMVIPDYV